MTRGLEHLVYEKKLTEFRGLGQSEKEKGRGRSILVPFNYLPRGYRENGAGDTVLLHRPKLSGFNITEQNVSTGCRKNFPMHPA